MEKREKQLKPVVGRQQLARRHAIGSGSTSSTSSPPPTAAAGCNGKERKGGDQKAALKKKKLKAKTFKWRSSNGDMNNKVEAGGSDQVCDDAVLCSLSTASFGGLVSWKRVRTLGKVTEQCDAVDPPVPRKLRSAINKRAGRFASTSPRHVKKRRHLSAISAQISFVDQETRSNGSSLFTEQEEAIADVLLSLSQVPSHSERTANKAIADSSNTNVASTSYSKEATKEGDQTVILPSAANELANQSACIDKVMEQTDLVTIVNPVAGTTDQSSNKSPPLSATEQIQDLSMGTAVNLPSPSKHTSNNSMQKQQNVQFDDSKCHPAQNPEAPLWLVNPDKSEGVPHEREKAKNNSAQEIAPLVQTPLPSPAGYLIKPSSSKLAARGNTISESTNFTTPGNQNKPLVKNVGAPKAWKRSITHVYVSHVIQMHVNKEKAAASSSQIQAKLEERPLARSSRPPSGGFTTSHKAAAAAVRDEKFYKVHFDVRVPAHQQPSAGGICDVGAGRQKIVSTTGDGTSTGCPVPAAPSDGATAAAAGRDAVPVPSPPCLQQGDSGTRRGTPADASATAVRVQPGVRPRHRRDLVGDDEEAAAATHADAAAAADVAVPCLSVPAAEAGGYAFPGVVSGGSSSLAWHFVVTAADGHACSPADSAVATAAADGAFLRAVPRWQAASAAEVDVAGHPSAAD